MLTQQRRLFFGVAELKQQVVGLNRSSSSFGGAIVATNQDSIRQQLLAVVAGIEQLSELCKHLRLFPTALLHHVDQIPIPNGVLASAVAKDVPKANELSYRHSNVVGDVHVRGLDSSVVEAEQRQLPPAVHFHQLLLTQRSHWQLQRRVETHVEQGCAS